MIIDSVFVLSVLLSLSMVVRSQRLEPNLIRVSIQHQPVLQEFSSAIANSKNPRRSLQTASNYTEGTALLAFRDAIESDPTGALANWTLESDYCSALVGVECNTAGRVESILLAGLGLNGTITSQIDAFDHLLVLNLS